MSSRIRIAACTITCCLLLAMVACAAIAAPFRIYAEVVHYQAGVFARNAAANPMGHGQVLIDGNKSIIAEEQAAMLVYSDEQLATPYGLSAYVQSNTPFDYPLLSWPPVFPGDNDSTKSGTMLNGRLYMSDLWCGIHQGGSPTWAAPSVPPDGPWGPAMPTGRVDYDCNGLVTDGTYLYSSDNSDFNYNWPPSPHIGPSYIYKWSVDPAANSGTGALTQIWRVQIPTNTWLISIGYYGGKLYAAEGFRGRNIYEIDCATGAYQTILSGDNLIPLVCGTDEYHMGQIARCGDRLVLGNWTGHLTQWKLVSGTWILQSCDGGNTLAGFPPYIIGLSLKPGPDGNAKYAWGSGANIVYFWDLTPFTGTPANLSAPRKSGYPVYVDAVVTANGPTGTFWVENPERTMGAQVLYGGAMPAVGKIVTLKAAAGTNAAGEQVLTAINDTDAVAVGATADPAVEPVFVTNKNLGPATGSAGLATDGMLVKVSGKVTGYDFNFLTSFYIDDGSGVANDTPNASTTTAVKGIQITKIDTSGFYSTGYDFYGGAPAYATVVGIARLQKLPDGTTIVRRIDVRDEAEVVITAL